MSSANTDLGLEHSRPTGSAVAAPLRTVVGAVATAVRGVAFWAAVVLPLASLFVLFVGPVTVGDLGTVAGLTTANAVALVVGHGHNSDDAARDGAAADDGRTGRDPVTLG